MGKAGAVAYAYHPPKFTRASMRIACMASIPTKSKPNYREADSQDGHTGKDTATGKSKATKFIERTVTVKSKTASPRPSKDAAGSVLSHAQHIGMLSKLPQSGVASSVKGGTPPAPQRQPQTTTKPPEETVPATAPRPIKSIPGITRRPKPANYDKQHLGPPPFTSDAPSPSSSSATSHLSPPYIPSPIESASSPPNWTHVVAQLSPPTSSASSSFPDYTSAVTNTVVKKSKPSLFIPRKRPKI